MRLRKEGKRKQVDQPNPGNAEIIFSKTTQEKEEAKRLKEFQQRVSCGTALSCSILADVIMKPGCGSQQAHVLEEEEALGELCEQETQAGAPV